MPLAMRKAAGKIGKKVSGSDRIFIPPAVRRVMLAGRPSEMGTPT
jgi:hypothetical protein